MDISALLCALCSIPCALGSICVYMYCRGRFRGQVFFFRPKKTPVLFVDLAF
jgi:hypothetical protein